MTWCTCTLLIPALNRWLCNNLTNKLSGELLMNTCATHAAALSVQSVLLLRCWRLDDDLAVNQCGLLQLLFFVWCMKRDKIHINQGLPPLRWVVYPLWFWRSLHFRLLTKEKLQLDYYAPGVQWELRKKEASFQMQLHCCTGKKWTEKNICHVFTYYLLPSTIAENGWKKLIHW